MRTGVQHGRGGGRRRDLGRAVRHRRRGERRRAPRAGRAAAARSCSASTTYRLVRDAVGSSRSRRSTSRASPSRSRRSGSSRSARTSPGARAASTRRSWAVSASSRRSQRRLRDRGDRPHVRTVHRARLAGRRQVAAGRGVPRRASADAAVLRGRCLSYGEGITFWPIAEIVRAMRPACRSCGRPRRASASRGPSSRARTEPRRDRGPRSPACWACRPSRSRARTASGRCAGSSRRSPRTAPLVAGARRHPLGRADAARPDRAPRRLVAGRARSCCSALARPELLDDPPGLGRRQARTPRSILLEPLTARRVERAGREPARSRGLPAEVARARSRRRPRATRCSSRRWSAC